jgi:hypothetical protein
MRGQTTITNAATEIATEVSNGNYWTYAALANMGDTTVYLQWTEESSNVTTANGFPLAANEKVLIDRVSGGPARWGPLQGIASSNCTIAYVIT